MNPDSLIAKLASSAKRRETTVLTHPCRRACAGSCGSSLKPGFVLSAAYLDAERPWRMDAFSGCLRTQFPLISASPGPGMERRAHTHATTG